MLLLQFVVAIAICDLKVYLSHVFEVVGTIQIPQTTQILNPVVNLQV
jgi:hypothetical protein